jgi:hypothetical protein
MEKELSRKGGAVLINETEFKGRHRRLHPIITTITRRRNQSTIFGIHGNAVKKIPFPGNRNLQHLPQKRL